MWPLPSRWLITTGLCSAMADAGQQAGIESRGEGIIAPENGENRFLAAVSKGGIVSHASSAKLNGFPVRNTARMVGQWCGIWGEASVAAKFRIYLDGVIECRENKEQDP